MRTAGPGPEPPRSWSPDLPAWLVVGLYVVAILVIVLVHEAGHFVTAKAFGIKVQEFFVGFGPRLWSVRRGETEYGLKALPFGGYVKIAGMNPYEDVPEEDLPRTFGAKPLWQRALVIGTGPVTHFLIAVLLLAFFFAAIGIPVYRPAVGAVCALPEGSEVDCPTRGPRSPAQRAGLRPGDVVASVDGRRVVSADQLVAYTRRHIGREIRVAVRRGGRTLALRVTPAPAIVDGERVGRLGVILTSVIVARDRTDPLTAAGRSVVQTGFLAKEVVVRLGDVFGPTGIRQIGRFLSGERSGTERPVSLVGVGRIAAQAAEAQAWDALLNLMVVFNVFVGIMNLIPLPPLDGGHLAVLVYEKATRRRPDARKLLPLTAAVAGFIILFAISITYLDIVNPVPNPFGPP